VIRLNVPFSNEKILSLNVGDIVLINGTIFTARDMAHLFLLDNKIEKLKGAVIYHCGPIINGSEVIAAGPTTSARLSKYTPKLIGDYGIKAIIGKGGMDNSVLNALKGNAVYFSAIGGAAVLYAKTMKVKSVDKLEFGMPEAIWELEVMDFPVILTMDAHGNSMYENVLQKSKGVFLKLINLTP